MIGPGVNGLKKLPFTIPELVTASPCRSSDGILYTGKSPTQTDTGLMTAFSGHSSDAILYTGESPTQGHSSDVILYTGEPPTQGHSSDRMLYTYESLIQTDTGPPFR